MLEWICKCFFFSNQMFKIFRRRKLLLKSLKLTTTFLKCAASNHLLFSDVPCTKRRFIDDILSIRGRQLCYSSSAHVLPVLNVIKLICRISRFHQKLEIEKNIVLMYELAQKCEKTLLF